MLRSLIPLWYRWETREDGATANESVIQYSSLDPLPFDPLGSVYPSIGPARLREGSISKFSKFREAS
jgi:hypothetical protein